MMEQVGELPAIREYVLAQQRNATLPFGQDMKKLVERMEK